MCKKRETFGLQGIEYSESLKQYAVNETRMFQFKGINLGSWDMRRESDNLLLAQASTEGDLSTLYVYPQFTWDGCTGVGRIKESKYTLLASLVHDILYIAKKNCHSLPFTLDDADILLKKLIDTWQKADGHKTGQGRIYYWGIKLLGWSWKFGRIKGYKIEKKA